MQCAGHIRWSKWQTLPQGVYNQWLISLRLIHHSGYKRICYGSMEAMNFIALEDSKLDTELNMLLLSDAYKIPGHFSVWQDKCTVLTAHYAPSNFSHLYINGGRENDCPAKQQKCAENIQFYFTLNHLKIPRGSAKHMPPSFTSQPTINDISLVGFTPLRPALPKVCNLPGKLKQ